MFTQDELETVQSHKEFAEKILDGEGEYDGADGARVVLELCKIILNKIK